MDREEHLAWCKKRALDYLHRGELANAVASMGSDLTKHPETNNYNIHLITLGLLFAVHNNTDGVRRWILGFQ